MNDVERQAVFFIADISGYTKFIFSESAKSLSTQTKLDVLDESGRIYWPPNGNVPSYKRYLDEMPGTPVDTIWDDIRSIGANAKERMGYATQKPVALLDRIIKASSNPGSMSPLKRWSSTNI